MKRAESSPPPISLLREKPGSELCGDVSLPLAPYLRLESPISPACARTCPLIASSIRAFVAPAFQVRAVQDSCRFDSNSLEGLFGYFQRPEKRRIPQSVDSRKQAVHADPIFSCRSTLLSRPVPSPPSTESKLLLTLRYTVIRFLPEFFAS